MGYVVVACVIVRFDVVLMRLSVRENHAERHYAAGLLDVLGNIGSVLCLRLQPATHRMLAGRLHAVFAPLKRAIVINEAKWCAVDLLSVGLTWGLVTTFVWRSSAAHDTVMIGALFMVYQYAQQAGEALVAVAREHLAPVLARRPVGLTLQVDEGQEAFDGKFGNLHPLFAK